MVTGCEFLDHLFQSSKWTSRLAVTIPLMQIIEYVTPVPFSTLIPCDYASRRQYNDIDNFNFLVGLVQCWNTQWHGYPIWYHTSKALPIPRCPNRSLLHCTAVQCFVFQSCTSVLLMIHIYNLLHISTMFRFFHRDLGDLHINTNQLILFCTWLCRTIFCDQIFELQLLVQFLMDFPKFCTGYLPICNLHGWYLIYSITALF